MIFVPRKSLLLAAALAVTLVCGTAQAQVVINTGDGTPAGTLTYSGAYLPVPISVQSDANLAAYLVLNPLSTSPTPVGSTAYTTTPVLTGAFPIPPWMANSAASNWIGPGPNGQSAGGPLAGFNFAGYSATQSSPQGEYYQTVTFTLGAGSISTSNLRWTSDNQGLGIVVNGVLQAGDTNNGDYTTFTPYTLTGLVNGLNTVTFISFNEQYGAAHASPQGLRVEGTITTNAIPEPSTFALLGLMGTLGLGTTYLRRSKKS